MPEPESELAREGCGQTSVRRQVVAGRHPGRSKVCSVALSPGSVLAAYEAVGWELGRVPERPRASAFGALQIEITRLATEARQHRVGLVRAELGESLHSTACGWPVASCRCWSRPRWRRCTRPRTACRGRSTGWHTPRWPPAAPGKVRTVGAAHVERTPGELRQ